MARRIPTVTREHAAAVLQMWHDYDRLGSREFYGAWGGPVGLNQRVVDGYRVYYRGGFDQEGAILAEAARDALVVLGYVRPAGEP